MDAPHTIRVRLRIVRLRVRRSDAGAAEIGGVTRLPLRGGVAALEGTDGEDCRPP